MPGRKGLDPYAGSVRSGANRALTRTQFVEWTDGLLEFVPAHRNMNRVDAKTVGNVGNSLLFKTILEQRQLVRIADLDGRPRPGACNEEQKKQRGIFHRCPPCESSVRFE